MSVRTIYNIACGNNTTKRGRRRIEQALGVLIWNAPAPTKPSEFDPASTKANPALYAKYRAQLRAASAAENQPVSHADL